MLLEVVGGQRRRGFDDRARRCHTRPDLRVAALQFDGEAAVGRRAVAHHDRIGGGLRADGQANEIGHRAVRLAGDHRHDACAHTDGGQDRPTARDRAIGRRIGGVVVRADQACPADAPPWRRDGGPRSRSVDESRPSPPRTDPLRPRCNRGPRRPRPPRPRHTRALARRARPARAAARADVSTSPVAGMPIAPSASSCSADGRRRVVGHEQNS